MSSPLESIRIETIDAHDVCRGVAISVDRTTPFDLEEDNGFVNPHIHSKEYASRYIHSAIWIFLLFGGYCFTRIVAMCGFPEDAQHHTWLGHSRNVTDLMLLGFVQAWFAEIVDTPGRWRCLHNSRWFYVLFFGSNLAFSILTSLPGFDEAVSDDSNQSWLFILILVLLTGLVIYVLVWHVVYAKKTLRTYKDFLGFVLFRAGTLGALVAAYLLVHNEETLDGLAKFHLHHYFVAWIVSLIAAFNHKISIACLAISAGIFVQGIGAYSAAALFYRGADKPCPEFRMNVVSGSLLVLVYFLILGTLMKFRRNEIVVSAITCGLASICWNLDKVDHLVDPQILIPFISVPLLVLVVLGTIILVSLLRRKVHDVVNVRNRIKKRNTKAVPSLPRSRESAKTD